MQEKWAHFSPVQFLPAFSVAPWDREQPSDLQREKGQTIISNYHAYFTFFIFKKLFFHQNYIYQY